MHYRWNFNNFPFIYGEFGRIFSPKLPAFIRAFLGKKIGARFKAIVPKLGITANTIPAIEHWYEQVFLADLNKHFAVHDFLLGGAPSIADFGFFGPLYAHLYRDPYPGKLMKKIAPHVAKWVERMLNAADVEGDFLPDDQIPETLLPILNNLFAQQWPVLEDTANKLNDWFKQKTTVEKPCKVPRILGSHQVKIAGVAEQRMVLPYSQWMMQRPLNFYQSLTVKEKNLVQPLLTKVNALNAMQFKLQQQLTRLNNEFVIQ